MVFLTKSAAASEEEWSAAAEEGGQREAVRTNNVRVMPHFIFTAMAVGNAGGAVAVIQILSASKTSRYAQPNRLPHFLISHSPMVDPILSPKTLI